MGDVRDVDFEQPTAGFGFGDVECVVVVFRIGGVDGDDQLVAVILATCDLFFGRLFRDFTRFAQDVFGE
jgi:hypothetical protein